MPKATLTFDLPEEYAEHACAIHGGDWKAIVSELASFLRNKTKYGHTYKTADEALDAVKTELWAFCNDFKLDPNED